MRNLAARRQMLEDRLAQLDARLHRIEDRLDDPVSKDWEDQAVEREDSEVLQDLGNAGLKEMELVRAALARIEDGSYGICLRCGEEISEARLDAVPHAALCRDCARGGGA